MQLYIINDNNRRFLECLLFGSTKQKRKKKKKKLFTGLPDLNIYYNASAITTCLLFLHFDLKSKEEGRERKNNVTISLCPKSLAQQSKCCLQFGKYGFKTFMSGLKFDR